MRTLNNIGYLICVISAVVMMATQNYLGAIILLLYAILITLRGIYDKE